MNQVVSLFQAAIVFGTVIMFGSIGEILTEKSGSLNLGVPGIMYLGGIASLVSAFLYEGACAKAGVAPSPVLLVVLPFVSAFAAAALGGLLFSFLTITLRANQNVTGLTLTIFAGGVANLFGGSLNKLAGGVGQISVAATSELYRARILGFLPLPDIVNKFLFNYGFMVYLAIILAVVLHIFLNKTNKGLNLRAVGESAATADAAGINVTKNKYLANCIGAGISGLGGLYYVMDYIKGTWANDGNIERLGWLAVALVIFSTWKPMRSVWGSYLFGLFYWVFLYIPGLSRRAQEIFCMLPYVVTIIVLIIVSMRKRKEDQPPESLGQAYFREER